MKPLTVPIAAPCRRDFAAMPAAGKSRYCDACQKDVHDLSSMTELEARAFLADARAVCVRVAADAEGAPIFVRPSPGFVPLANLRMPKGTRGLLRAGALAVSVAAASACSSGSNAAPAPQVPTAEVMGEYVPDQVDVRPSDPAIPAPSATQPSAPPSSTTAPPPSPSPDTAARTSK